jgi:hypothetical protein
MKPTDKKDEQHKGHARGAEKPGELHRDESRRDRGPVYHGHDWERADEEAGRESLDEPSEQEAESDVERADEDLTEPGTRGAVFGRAGKGLVERKDEPPKKGST